MKRANKLAKNNVLMTAYFLCNMICIQFVIESRTDMRRTAVYYIINCKKRGI